MTPRPVPLGRCTRCADLTYDAAEVNAPCRRQYSGRACQGHYFGAFAADDWKSCSRCAAHGCSRCGNVGWHYVRHLPDRLRRAI